MARLRLSGGRLAVVGGSRLGLNAAVSFGAPLHEFTLQDTSGTGSTGFGPAGLAFEKGDVLSSQVLQAEIGGSPIRSRMLRRNTWSDGSLRSCVLAYDAGTFTAGQTKTVQVKAVAGSQGTSGFDPVAYLAGQDDLNVQVTNHSGHSTGALADRAYSLNAALAVGTRHEVTDSTDLVVRLKAWQLPAGEVHLKCYHYVDLWLNESAVVQAVSWVPVMAQDWIVDNPLGTGSVQKEVRTYDAAIREATTVLESHAGLQHAYHCRWAGLRTANDDQHGKPLWIAKGAAMPTLNLSYSAASITKMAKVGYLPPIARGVTYSTTFVNGSVTDTIVPLGELGSGSGDRVNNQRRAINGTGGYNGRGLISDMDARTLAEQTAARWRVSRVSAQAALSVFMHHRDHRTVDTAAVPGVVPAPLARLGAQSYPGLGSEDTVILSNGTPSGAFADGQNYDIPVGPALSATTPGPVGTFTAWDDAHHHSYGYFMAFVEGEAYLEDAALSAFDMPHRRGATGSTVDVPLAYRSVFGTTARETAFGITTELYGSTHITPTQERSPAWTLLSALRAYQLMSDSDAHVPYLENQFNSWSQWVNNSLSFFPAGETARGGWQPRFTTGAGVGSTFMNSFGVMCSWTAVPVADDLGFTGVRAYAEQTTKLTSLYFGVAPYASLIDRDLRFLDGTDKIVPPPSDVVQVLRSGSVTSDVFSYTDYLGTLKIRDGDRIFMSDADSSGSISAITPGLSAETEYFVINANPGANTFQVSLTEGGAAVTGITDDATVNFGVHAADMALTPLGTNSADLPLDDSTGQMAYCALQVAYGYGSANVSASLVSDAETFYAPKEALWPNSTYAAWNMDGGEIR